MLDHIFMVHQLDFDVRYPIFHACSFPDRFATGFEPVHCIVRSPLNQYRFSTDHPGEFDPATLILARLEHHVFKFTGKNRIPG